MKYFNEIMYNMIVLAFLTRVTLVDMGLYHKLLNLVKFECEITFESVPRTNQY